MPGRAAYMDGRSGSSSMRLNFAGVSEHDIREGIRRIGRALREQVGLLGSLTGSPSPRDGTRGARAAGRPGGRAARRRRRAASPRLLGAGAPHAGPMSGGQRVAVLKGGRSLERSVSLRSGAQVQDALQRLGHEVLPIDVDPELVAAPARPRNPTRRSSRCTGATARTAPCRGCSRRSACPTRHRDRPPACARPTRCSPST